MLWILGFGDLYCKAVGTPHWKIIGILGDMAMAVG